MGYGETYMSGTEHYERTEGKRLGQKYLERNEPIVYGNDTIGHYHSRHEAVGEAAIHARKDPFPFGEDFEWRSDDERRGQIFQRMRFVHAYRRSVDTETSQEVTDE